MILLICFCKINICNPLFANFTLDRASFEMDNFHIWFWIGWHEPYIIDFEFANYYLDELLSYVFTNKKHSQLPDCKFHIQQSQSIFTYGFELDDMNHTLFILNLQIVIWMFFSHVFTNMIWTIHYWFWICKLLSGWTSLICFRK